MASRPLSCEEFLCIWGFKRFIFYSHIVYVFDILRKIFLNMITCMMTIYSMSITNTKKPVVFYLGKVLAYKQWILICFGWLSWNISCSWFMSIFQNWIRNSNINDIWRIQMTISFSLNSFWRMFLFVMSRCVIVTSLNFNRTCIYRRDSLNYIGTTWVIWLVSWLCSSVSIIHILTTWSKSLFLRRN